MTDRTIRIGRRGAVVSAATALFAATHWSATGSPAAAAATADTARHGCAPDGAPGTISAVSPELYPEGVAWDPTREAFLVTSTRQGNVSVVRTDGSTEELTPSMGMVSTLGIKVDPGRNRILVTYSDYWVRRMLPVDQPPMSGVAVIDLATGRLVRQIDTAQGRENTFANDLAFDQRTGTVYVTDSVSAALQQIDLRGRVTDLVTDERFAAEFIGLNGIACHPDGFLLTSRYDTGALFRVGLSGEPSVERVEVEQSLVGVDGLTLRGDGALLAVQNNLGAALGMAEGDTALTALTSDDGWRSAQVANRTDPWPFNSPTTVATSPLGAYAVSGQVNVLMSGVGTADEFWLKRLTF